MILQQTINDEAEYTVLGALLIDPNLAGVTSLTEEHFYYETHKLIMQSILAVHEKDLVVDIESVTLDLVSKRVLEEVGNVSYLTTLAEAIPTTKNFHFYESAVFEAYRARETRKIALSYASDPTDDSLRKMMDELDCLQSVGIKMKAPSIDDVLLEIADDLIAGPDEDLGYELGFKDFDQMTGGLQRGDLIVIAARPSVGKTAFALNLARGHCEKGGTTHIFSLEMDTKQLVNRLISQVGRIDGQKLRLRTLDTTDYENGMRAIGEIANWKLHIHDAMYRLDEIKTTVRKMIQEKPDEKHLIVIDYLQLIQSSKRAENRNIEVGQMTRELKLLARELRIPIVVLSQLSRKVEQRQDKRPILSDLRESGSIEQDADVVGFLHRDDYYEEDNGQNIIEIILQKQRNGPIGTIRMKFLKEYGKFVDLTCD